MKLVFCGTPSFGVPTLEAVIAARHDVMLVVAQPDRPAGRGMKLQIGAVKQAALKHSLPLVQPERIKNNPDLQALVESSMPDAILVVAYGRIIPDWMLALPRYGCINLHGSLLPKYRGAAPIQWAIANAERETGVTTMRLDAGLDTGPTLLAEKRKIAPEQNAIDLYECLAEDGAKLVVKTLAGLEAGEITPIPQNNDEATLAPLVTREDGRMNFRLSAKQLSDRWRAFQPWPGAWTTIRGKKLIVHRLSLAQDVLPIGQVRHAEERLLVGCGNESSLELLEVQVEGKKRISAREFLHGFQLREGERLGA